MLSKIQEKWLAEIEYFTGSYLFFNDDLKQVYIQYRDYCDYIIGNEAKSIFFLRDNDFLLNEGDDTYKRFDYNSITTNVYLRYRRLGAIKVKINQEIVTCKPILRNKKVYIKYNNKLHEIISYTIRYNETIFIIKDCCDD